MAFQQQIWLQECVRMDGSLVPLPTEVVAVRQDMPVGQAVQVQQVVLEVVLLAKKHPSPTRCQLALDIWAGLHYSEYLLAFCCVR